MVLRKKETYTVITPIPGFIPRQLAIDILHSHGEVITLNPLVLSYEQIPAPQNALTDEYFSTWYAITERLTFVPGIGKFGASVVTFNGCFHDLPWGLQTHIYAPANIDMRNKYRIAGNQPGIEAPEPQEMGLAGLGVPKDGLYLREDIEIKCNVAMASYVKKQMKAASKAMVERIVKKAELLDSGLLTAMIEDGKLKTQNPNARASVSATSPRPESAGGPNQRRASQPPMSPGMPYKELRPMSYQMPPSMQQHQQYNSIPGREYSHVEQPQISELPAQAAPQQQTILMELPGSDTFHHPQPSPGMQSSGKSTPLTNDWRWSQSQPSPGLQQSHTRPSSYDSQPGASPGLDHKGFASDLGTHRETREEYNAEALSKLDPTAPPRPQKPAAYAAYNPADYARLGR